MKKLFVILVAVIGLGIGANAQNVYVSKVDQGVSPNGKSVIIYVTVKGELDVAKICNLGIKVCPTTRNVLDALFIDCQYGTLGFSNINGGGSKYAETTVTFSCSVKQNEDAPRCGAYDFAVEITNDDCK